MDSQGKDTEESIDIMIERLKLDMKAAMLLARGSSSYRSNLKKQILDSPDLDIRSFVELISEGDTKKPRNQLLIAIGEIAFSSILIYLGLVMIIPTFFSLYSPVFLLGYFVTFFNTQASALETLIVVMVDFIISVLMLISAFQLLRIAAQLLERSGLTVKDAP